jgi:hypothetical protein
MQRFMPLLVLAGCVTPTAYQPLADTGGYTDKQLSLGRYAVAFYGNAKTHPDDVLAGFKRRSLELCNGAAYLGQPTLLYERRWTGKLWMTKYYARGDITCASEPL